MIRDPTCFICTEYLDGTYLVDHHFPRYEAVILKKSFFKFGTSEICPVSNFQHFWSHSSDNNSSSNNNNNRSEWFLRRRLTPSYFGFCVFPVCNLLSIILCTFHVCFCSLLHIFLFIFVSILLSLNLPTLEASIVCFVYLFKNGPFPASFSLFFVFSTHSWQYTIIVQYQ